MVVRYLSEISSPPSRGESARELLALSNRRGTWEDQGCVMFGLKRIAFMLGDDYVL